MSLGDVTFRKSLSYFSPISTFGVGSLSGFFHGFDERLFDHNNISVLVKYYSPLTESEKFVYVKYDINSSFMTYKKKKNSTINSSSSSNAYISVYTADHDLWRKN